MKINKVTLVAVLFAYCFINPAFVLSQLTASNSNYWPVFRDDKTGFRISYPPSWIVTTPKGKNVKFSVNPPGGPGNCNVVAYRNTEISNENQANLNQLIESLPQDGASWADYVSLPVSQVRVISTGTARIIDIPALLGVVEINLENIEGKYMRKQKIVLTFTPGLVWSLNCGATSFNINEVRDRFDALESNFNKIFSSFVFTFQH